MKFAPALLVAPLLAAGLAVGVTPSAQADTPTTISDLTVEVAQAPGKNDSWKVTSSWSATSAALRFTVKIGNDDHATTAYKVKDVSTTSAEVVVDGLGDDQDYWIVVTPAAPFTGDAVATSFHTGTLDTTAPDGEYKLNKTSVYADVNLAATSLEEIYVANVVLTQTSISETATRMVRAGDGTAAKAWTSNGPFVLAYHKDGTFKPTVTVTDVFGNESVEQLPTVRVLIDRVAPRVSITTPAKPTKSSSWRVIRGTATDAETGVAAAMVFVMEKRGATWYAYDFRKKKWLKGYTSATKTEAKTKAEPGVARISANGSWQAPAIKGLKKGTLKIQAGAFDELFNVGEARPVIRKVR